MPRMLHQYVRWFGQKLAHRRGADTIKESDGLKIHLSAIELVFLGVGRNLGAGLYIVVGAVAKYVAGPAIVVCFLVAGLSSLLSRLCYVEFDARVPRSSSAYVCSYVTPPVEKQRRRLHTALVSGGWAGKRGAAFQYAI